MSQIITNCNKTITVGINDVTNANGVDFSFFGGTTNEQIALVQFFTDDGKFDDSYKFKSSNFPVSNQFVNPCYVLNKDSPTPTPLTLSADKPFIQTVYYQLLPGLEVKLLDGLSAHNGITYNLASGSTNTAVITDRSDNSNRIYYTQSDVNNKYVVMIKSTTHITNNSNITLLLGFRNVTESVARKTNADFLDKQLFNNIDNTQITTLEAGNTINFTVSDDSQYFYTASQFLLWYDTAKGANSAAIWGAGIRNGNRLVYLNPDKSRSQATRVKGINVKRTSTDMLNNEVVTNYSITTGGADITITNSYTKNLWILLLPTTITAPTLQIFADATTTTSSPSEVKSGDKFTMQLPFDDNDSLLSIWDSNNDDDKAIYSALINNESGTIDATNEGDKSITLTGDDGSFSIIKQTGGSSILQLTFIIVAAGILLFLLLVGALFWWIFKGHHDKDIDKANNNTLKQYKAEQEHNEKRAAAEHHLSHSSGTSHSGTSNH